MSGILFFILISLLMLSQVTSLLRRVLPEVTPVRLASIIGVKSLPPADISDIIHSTEKGDWNKLCILDMFLGCIAKALTVQLKAKGTTISGTAGMAAGKGVTTVTLPMIFNSRWVSWEEVSFGDSFCQTWTFFPTDNAAFSATFVEGRATGGWKAPLLLR